MRSGSRPVGEILSDLYVEFWSYLERRDVPALLRVWWRVDELQALNPRALRWGEARYEMDVLGALARGDDEAVVARSAHLSSAGSEDSVEFARAIALVNLGRSSEAVSFCDGSTREWAKWLTGFVSSGKSAPELVLGKECDCLRWCLRLPAGGGA